MSITQRIGGAVMGVLLCGAGMIATTPATSMAAWIPGVLLLLLALQHPTKGNHHP